MQAKTILVGFGITLAVLFPFLAVADVGPPAHLQITETEPGLFTVQWRVPKALPPRAVPVPVLPDGCSLAGKRTVVGQPGAWLFTQDWRCEAGLTGRLVGMRYPFPDLALTTVMRVDLLSGDRFAHVLGPGEAPWRIPEGTMAADPVRDAQRAVVTGILHALRSWLHVAFVVVVALLGRFATPIRVVTAFTLGQIAGALVGGVSGGLGAVSAEIGLAVGVALLARQALAPSEGRRRLAMLAAAAGLAHGLGVAGALAGDVGDERARLSVQLFAILGMDAAHLVGAVGIAALWSVPAGSRAMARIRPGVAYGIGAAGIALAIGLSLEIEAADAGGGARPLVLPARSSSGPPGGVSGSRRLAPAALDAPVQSYLAVEPFEVRHEVMLRVVGMTGGLDLDPESTVAIENQTEVLDRVARLVLDDTEIRVHGQRPEPLVRRVDFMTVDATGALPRTNPVPERVSEAVIGVVVAYPVTGMPERVSLQWDRFPLATGAILATVIDPESVTSWTLSSGEPSLTWENRLAEDPIPKVAAVEVESTRMPIPVLSLPLLLLAGVLVVVGVKRRPFAPYGAAARVLLAAALVVGPITQTAVALPGTAGRTPSERQARRIVAGLLPNIYRAMEFRDEATIYDRLAVSVTGEALADVYLEQRRALEVEERGGAQARVEAVEVLKAEEIESREGGFEIRSTWKVGGMVTHFGHRHFRENRYDARIGIVPVAGTWKIRSIEVLDQERVR